MELLFLILAISLLLMLVLGFAWLKSFRRGRPLVGFLQLLSSFTLLLLLLSIGLLFFSTFGYQQLTYEQPIADIHIQKHSEQRFTAAFFFENGLQKSYEISGDEIYIDARILKWKPWANLLGVHTLFRLDRIGGRYLDYEQEVNKQRTLFQFEEDLNHDLFDYRTRYTILESLVDAEYGNGAFIPVKDESQYQLTLSTSGLILRSIEESP